VDGPSTKSDGPEVKPAIELTEPTVKPATETAAPKTGAEQAKAKGFPEAPEGYVWVKRESGEPYLRRMPGRTDLPEFHFDPSKNAFVDANTGLALKTPAEVEAMARVKATPKGDRPDPSSYLSREHIDAHLKPFEEGSAYIVPKESLDARGRDLLGRPDGQFVMTKAEMDAMIARTGGDTAKIETELGIPPGSWQGKNLVRIDITDAKALNLRMPSGNEAGANDLWLPGGRLPTGQAEAVVNQIPKGAYTETPVRGNP
jgi:hypothetical protein